MICRQKEDAGIDAECLNDNANYILTGIHDRVYNRRDIKLSNSRAERKVFIVECSNLIDEIDDLRIQIEEIAAENRYLDMDSALEGLKNMLDIVYPAHRDGISPYSEALADLAYDVMRTIEGATEATREAYYEEMREESEHMQAGAPVFDW